MNENEMKKAFDKVAAEAVNKFAKEVKKEANRCYEYDIEKIIVSIVDNILRRDKLV